MASPLTLSGLGVAGLILSDYLLPGPRRSIGGIVATITIEEDHRDTLVITEHPVEQGATITDHAYKQPSEVRLRVGWSSALINAGFGAFDPNYLQTIYNQLLQLQSDRIPFKIVTGKRSYSNMLIRSIGVTTDNITENVLFVTLDCKEVILVNTQVTSAPASTSDGPALPLAVGPTNVAAALKQPEATLSSVNVGSTQLLPSRHPNLTGLPFNSMNPGALLGKF